VRAAVRSPTARAFGCALAGSLLALCVSGCAAGPERAAVEARAAVQLASWSDGGARAAIEAFVARVTDPGHPDFVPEAERIAVFDNDGTLWAEQPVYIQLAFAMDRVRALAPTHPEWRETEPFASVLRGDAKGLAAQGEEGVARIVAATHAGMTPEEFRAIVRAWLAEARHPTTGRRYDEMVYAPMLELLAYLRARGFRTYIVSGGGVEFMRAFSERVYGVPPEQVIGSVGGLRVETREGVPVLVKQPAVDFIDDKEGKPIAIERSIGRRPIMAFGNSDGDLAMLAWTAAGEGPRFSAIVHHTDAAREWSYDRASHIGRLDRALDAARERDWTVIDMARDWRRVFP
jgi:phosphoserine phosphatase